MKHIINFKNFLIRIKKYLKENREIISNLIKAFVFFFAFEILHYFNPGIATYPIAIFQKIAYAVLAVVILWSVALSLINGFNPKLRTLVDRNNIKQFDQLPLWLKYSFAFGILALLFWGLVKAMSSL
jgi:hypothetical protein